MTATTIDRPGTEVLGAAPWGRRALLAGGGLALVMGTWTGLARAGVHDPFGPVAAHGVLMVLGFLGTLIALERAVALGDRWPYVSPALSGAAVVWLTAGLPAPAAGLALTAAGALLVAMYAVLLRRRIEPAVALMAAGAAAWPLAAGLWTVGWSPIRLTPVLAAFLVLTIVGERLELSRLRAITRRDQQRLLIVAAVFGAGSVIALLVRPVGLAVGGVGLVGQAAWLARNDIARVTIRKPGLPRFAAVCLLAGYAWLAIAGLLWVGLAAGVGGWLLHDAALHVLFLGFVMSMVFAHAPIILPAILRTTWHHRRAAWLPVGLLHASVALRLVADLAGSAWLRGWAAHGNVTALLLFVAVAVAARRPPDHRPTPIRPAGRVRT